MEMKVIVLQWDDGLRMYSKPIEDNGPIHTAAEAGKNLYKADSYSVVDYVQPGDGGCWFCSTMSDDMLFDGGFDTNVHKLCLERVLKSEPDHPEAGLMSYLLEEEN
jgi:hypothetical protein